MWFFIVFSAFFLLLAEQLFFWLFYIHIFREESLRICARLSMLIEAFLMMIRAGHKKINQIPI